MLRGLRQWQYYDTLKIVVTCAVWYAGSMLNSIYGKSAMKMLPYPNTVTIVQLISVNLVLPFFLKEKMPRLRTRDWKSWILPLTLLKILGSISSQLSILKVPVSYAHTVKACMPIFTVFLSRFFLKQSHSRLAYASLIPIMAGVIISSVTEIEFNLVGLISALLSTFIFAIQNIFSKKVLKGGVNHIALLTIVSQASLAIMTPYWLINEGFGMLFGDTVTALGDKMFTVLFELLFCGLANSMQTIFAFTFLSYVSPVTYSVANVTKRVVIISASMIVFNNPVTFANVTGMLIAIGGIALYNKAKLDEKKKQQQRFNEAEFGMHQPPPELPLHNRGGRSVGDNNERSIDVLVGGAHSHGQSQQWDYYGHHGTTGKEAAAGRRSRSNSISRGNDGSSSERAVEYLSHKASHDGLSAKRRHTSTSSQEDDLDASAHSSNGGKRANGGGMYNEQGLKVYGVMHV